MVVFLGPLHRNICEVSLFFLTPPVLSRWHVTAVASQLILSHGSLRASSIPSPWTWRMTKRSQKALCALWVTPRPFFFLPLTLHRARPPTSMSVPPCFPSPATSAFELFIPLIPAVIILSYVPEITNSGECSSRKQKCWLNEISIAVGLVPTSL